MEIKSDDAPQDLQFTIVTIYYQIIVVSQLYFETTRFPSSKGGIDKPTAWPNGQVRQLEVRKCVFVGRIRSPRSQGRTNTTGHQRCRAG